MSRTPCRVRFVLVALLGDAEPVALAEHGLAHAGAAGDDDELGRLDRAEDAVEPFDARRDAGIHVLRLDRHDHRLRGGALDDAVVRLAEFAAIAASAASICLAGVAPCSCRHRLDQRRCRDRRR
jgi:hypothetical protein